MLDAPPPQGDKRKKRPLPRAMANEMPGEHLCPLPTCSRSSSRHGKGWADAAPAVQHVANTHVANGVVPSQSWLNLHGKWMCGHCLALVPVGRQCHGENCYQVAAKDLPSRWAAARHVGAAPPIPVAPAVVPGTPLRADWPGHSTLQDVMSLQKPLLRHIPKGALHAWGLEYARLLSNLLHHQTWESLRDVIAFPKLTLGLPHRGGAKHKDELAREVKRRLDRFREAGFEALWQETKGRSTITRKRQPSKRAPASVQDKVARLSEDNFVSALEGLMQDGAFSKAVKHLLSEGIHDASDHRVLQALECLHPKGDPIDMVPPSEPWHWDDSEDGKRERLFRLKSVVLDFPRGTLAGPSGLRPQHLQDVLRTAGGAANVLLASLDLFVKACIDGSLHRSAFAFLCAANLIPLRKPEPGLAVRPVAVGETMRRMVSRFVSKSPVAADLVQTMRPHQTGVATPGACETIGVCPGNPPLETPP